MISTYSQVKTRALALLDDPLQQTFKDAIVLEGLGEAIDALYSAFLGFQIPRIKIVATYTLPAGATSLTPATAGIADFGELIHLEERADGSTDKYAEVWETNNLPQRAQGDRLQDFEWRGDAFYFVGATVAIQLRFAYFTSATQPADFTPSTGVDGAKTFLAKYCAGIIGRRKGYDELAGGYMDDAVGSRYNQGVIGGELFRLCQPMVRSMQRVQIAPRPFSATGRMRVRRALPYVAASNTSSSSSDTSMPPTQYSTTDGSISGVIDGANGTFLLPQSFREVTVFLNGLRMTVGTDCTVTGLTIQFVAGQIPTVGSVITVDGYV